MTTLQCQFYHIQMSCVNKIGNSQGYLVLSIFQNRDLLKVNTQDGRCGFLTAPELTRKLTMKGFITNSVRLGNRTIGVNLASIQCR